MTKNNNQHKYTSHYLRRTYIVSYIIVTLSIIASFKVYRCAVVDHVRTLHHVETVLRNKILSDEIVSLLSEEWPLSLEQEKLFAANVKEFTENHQIFLRGTDLLSHSNFSAFNISDATGEAVVKSYEELVVGVKEYLDRGFHELASGERANFLASLHNFSKHSDIYLQLIIKTSDMLSHEHERTFLLLTLAQIVLLVGICFLLFEPLIRKVQRIVSEREDFILKLQESEERFDLSVTGSHDGIWDWNVKTNEVFYSNRFIELLGYEREQFPAIFKSWEQTLHPEDRFSTLRALEEHLKEHVPYDVEYRCKSEEGVYRWYRARGQAIWHEDGTPLRMAGSLSDISRYKLLSKQLEKAHRNLSLAISATGLGLWTWNIENDIGVCNDHWYQMLGYQPGEFNVNRVRWFSLIHPEDSSRLKSEFRKLESGSDSVFREELRLRRADGEWHWVLLVGRVVEVDSAEAPTDAIFAQVDIDHVHRAKDEAIEANRTKSAFLANISHEIRTPMNGVLGMTGLLLETTLDEEQHELATAVHASAESLLRVISDILDFSRLEAGKIDIITVTFDIRQLFEQLARFFSLRLEQKRIELLWEVAETIPERVRGDEDRLRQVLYNLIGNALKFTPDGGRVRVRAVDTGSDASHTFITFTVQDSGPGVPKEKQAKIFEAFEQIDVSSNRQHGGTGLGLTIVAHLVQYMGGTFGVESELGKGATFYFQLHFIKAPESSVAISHERGRVADIILPPLHVLLVEDNKINQELVVRVLSKAGCQVTVAANGMEGLEIFQEKEFDVVLMDIRMPVMDGEEATKRIRTLERGRDIPIIALTAHASMSDREKYLSIGMTDYLTKPVRKADLFKSIAQAVTLRSDAASGDVKHVASDASQ